MPWPNPLANGVINYNNRVNKSSDAAICTHLRLGSGVISIPQPVDICNAGPVPARDVDGREHGRGHPWTLA